MTIDTVDDFLDHSGVKGMKWGQRKAELKTANEHVRTATTDLTKAKAERHIARINMAKSVASIAGTAAVLAGGIALAVMLKKHNKRPVKTLKQDYDIVVRGKDFVTKSNNPEAMRITLEAMNARKRK